jgi:fructokinase
VDLPTRPVDVVDTVGAGDAFTAGLLDALGRHGLLGPGGSDRLAGCDTSTLRDALERATVVAALTCARRGADPPTATEVETFLRT